MNPDNKNPITLGADVVSIENIDKNQVPNTESKDGAVKLLPHEVAKQRRENVSNFIADKKESFKNGIQNVGQKISNFFGRVKSFKDKAIDVAIAPDAYIKSGIEKISGFTHKRVERMTEIANAGKEFADFAADFAKSKTFETFERVKKSVENRYDSIKQFGIDAVESSKDRVFSIKENLRNRKNEFIISILRSIQEKYIEKANKIQSTIDLLQSI